MSSETKLQKIYIEFDDPASGLMQYQQENLGGEWLEFIQLPFDLSTFSTNYVKLELYSTLNSEPVIVEGLEKLKYLVLGDEYETLALKEWKRANPILYTLLPSYFQQAQTNFPTIEMSDVTERDMFGYEEIPQTRLGDKGGIWAWHGVRKLEFKVTGLNFDEENKGADEQQKVGFYFFKMGREFLEDVVPVDEIRYNVKRQVYVAYLNTNRLGEEMEKTDDHQPTFSGRFEVHLYNRYFKTVHSFPVEICVHSTKLNEDFENHLFDDNGIVSIDFGTSSTCAAVKGVGRPELITLSGEGKRKTKDGMKNPYENPTNIMIYTWDEFYHQWERANKSCPFLITTGEGLTESEVDYDSGYTVDEILKEINSDKRGQRRARAVVTELKTIPSMSDEKRQQVKIHPLNDVSGKIVCVTDSPDAEDDNNLDPIAFYGYLLSRAINNPVHQKIYYVYNIAFPVKFEKKVRDKICASLAYGIRRALPRPIAEAMDDDEPFVKVNMEYEESVACAGAVVANQLVINNEDPAAKPFAILDLGGGTLDTAYGIFRKAVGEEGDGYTIQIFGCGGNERVGGEKIIHQLAYKIYLDNREIIEELQIPFVLPFGEKFPKGFEGLLSDIGDEISNANVITLKENLARILFQRDDPEGVDNRMTEIFGEEMTNGAADEITIKLRDKSPTNIEGVDVKLKVTGVEEFLREKILKIVDDFKADMDRICSTDKVRAALKNSGIEDYRPEYFSMFLGGNASKQHYVEELMREIFPSNRIERIKFAKDDNSENLSERYLLNSKTAVAFGQLNLEDYFIDKSTYQTGENDRAPFPFNVGYKDSGSGEFVIVLEKNNNSLEWVRANSIGKNNGRTQLLFTTDPNCDPDTLKSLNKKVKLGENKNKRTLWIRVAPDAHNSIEYRLGGSEENFSPDEPQNDNMLFQLSE